MSSKARKRRTMPEAIVPYLRMSGRWLEDHGFVIGTSVQVIVEHGRVTLTCGAAESLSASQLGTHHCELQDGSIVLVTPEHHDAHVVEERMHDAPSRADD